MLASDQGLPMSIDDSVRQLKELAEVAASAQKAWDSLTDTEREHILAILTDAKRAETVSIEEAIRQGRESAREIERSVRKMEERR